MTKNEMIAALDEEIVRLEKVRSLLAEVEATSSGPTKRVLSPEARAKISAAQNERWADQKKSKG